MLSNARLTFTLQNAKVFKRAYEPPRLPVNATQEQLNESVITDDFKYMRYDVIEENDIEPADIKVLLLRSSEGKAIVKPFMQIKPNQDGSLSFQSSGCVVKLEQ